MSEKPKPTRAELARASQTTYSMSKTGNRADRLKHAQDNTPNNYTVMPEHTDRMITTMKHNTDNHYIVAHRGTDLHGSQSKKDLEADFHILTGNTEDDATHKRRTTKTARIVKALKGKGDIYLTGHSLGGSTAHHAMVHSKVVRDGVKQVDTFNTGSSPFQTKEHKSNSKAYKDIHSKTTHHHIEGDEISSNVKSGYIGKHKTYKSNKKPTIAQHIFNTVKPIIEMSPLGKLGSFLGEKLSTTLSAHSLKHFF